MASLSGQTAVVTGGGSGIGRAIALALGAEGASLALVGRRPAPLESAAAAARSEGAEACTYPADLGRHEDIRDLCASLERDLGRVDILVHSAGIHMLGAVAEAPEGDFEAQFRVNVLGAFALTQRLLRLIQHYQGQIVFINSSAGLNPRAGVSQFSATKHALRALASALRDEVNQHGVRVLSVYPGRTASPNQERIHQAEGRPYRSDRLLQPQDVAAIIVSALCLPRTAEVTEISIRPMLKPT
jgi:NAD(P)-dependent dehydrogenase (short-subunit alcohol dehydrogenase family)